MQKRVLTGILTAALGLGLGNCAFAATGPLQTPLKVTSIYAQQPSGTLYVSFQAGAMPGCYSNQGGYLYVTNSFYKELYAQLLLMVANGGVRASVIYTVNASANEWSDCTIDGIYLLPQ